VLPAPFASLVRAENPALLCRIAAARTSTKRHIASVKFELRKGLGSSAGPLLEKIGLAANAELAAFYSLHDGMTLFSCEITGKFPLEIYKLKSIPAKTRAMQRWIGIDDFPEIEAVEDPFGLRTAIAVGGSPNSSSYLAVAVQGPYAGSVFQVDHGGTPDGPLANSFVELLTFAAEKPVEFLRVAAAYPRYSDGKTAILWEPIDYSPSGEFSV
jgi:hypothetical protein